MTIKTYVKKPIPIKAIQWFKETPWNEIEQLLDTSNRGIDYNHEEDVLVIHTLEGDMKCKVGDYIVRGVRGELYPCAKEIFEETYECVGEEQVDESKVKEIECEDCGC